MTKTTRTPTATMFLATETTLMIMVTMMLTHLETVRESAPRVLAARLHVGVNARPVVMTQCAPPYLNTCRSLSQVVVIGAHIAGSSTAPGSCDARRVTCCCAVGVPISATCFFTAARRPHRRYFSAFLCQFVLECANVRVSNRRPLKIDHMHSVNKTRMSSGGTMTGGVRKVHR